MPKVKANGIDLHYLAFGYGPDVVLIHGFLGNLAVWHLQIAPQLRKLYRVTSYDLRGHGYSELTPTGYTARQMASDLGGLLDSLNIDKATLIGHSYGADIAMYFTLKHPERVRKLVAIEPGLACLASERKSQKWEGWAYWVAKLEGVGITVPEDKRTDIDYLLETSLKTSKIFGPARGLPRNREPLLRLLQTTTLMSEYDDVGELTRDAVRTIRTPTLLIYGDHSQFIGSYDFLKSELPNCTPVLLAGGEHFGPLETPELLTQHIVDFVDVPSGQISGSVPTISADNGVGRSEMPCPEIPCECRASPLARFS
jgi:pimeloyl-ACP methyl ester carboxylesterase